MLRYIIWTLIFYGLFRLIVNFIIPVFRATRQMKSQVKAFQERVNTEEQYRSAAQPSGAARQQTNNKAASGDYIDFEEIRK